eukprot:COSAG06_NODE_12818_length_1316_cov_10.115918_2_plen_96_part_00
MFDPLLFSPQVMGTYQPPWEILTEEVRKKRIFFALLYTKNAVDLPRQAWDRHIEGKSTQKREMRFSFLGAGRGGVARVEDERGAYIDSTDCFHHD